MGMIKKLTKQGNSLALIIDKPLLELMDIDENTLLEISTPDGSCLLVRPVRDRAHDQIFDKLLDRIHEKHGKLFQRLADEE